MACARVRLVLLTAAIAGSAAGCIMPDQIARIEKDVADVRVRLARMEQAQGETRSAIEEVERRLAADSSTVTSEDLRDLEVRVDQIREGMSTTDEQVGDLGRRVDRLALQIQQRELTRSMLSPAPPDPTAPMTDPGVVPAPSRSAAAGALPDPESLYNTAYADFSKGNYALAVSGFEEYRTKFPDSSLADNAMYWIGECHFSQGSFPDSVAAFDRLLETYPRSEKAAAANLKKGLAYLEQNDVRRAIVQLRFVVSEYPQTDEAKVARDKLTSLGATT